MTNFQSLTSLGWSPFFQQQLTLEEWEQTIPARIFEQQKSILTATTDTSNISIPVHHSMPEMTVGDWVLLDKEQNFLRLLDRKSCFKRKAAGIQQRFQLIASNVDTAFILMSMNLDFNLNRLERYLSLVNEAGVEPVVILTKSDLVTSTEEWQQQILAMDNTLAVIPVNAFERSCLDTLSPWLSLGKTCVLLGSSGVGKSTLTNTLIGKPQQLTNEIRLQDAKGRHTTTSRSLLKLENGGLVLDTPGMRELQLADCETGISATFADIEGLSSECRFKDCQHINEPGCAVITAVESGQITQRRLSSYHKLIREEANNSASIAEKRAKEKSFGKFVKHTMKQAYKLKGRD
ncbi:ribosome small subunit-dependent GTPase A [Glaciecola sp. 1036]|uniref:ribosome small subunit-dependent GTPase A n=1 Tax=Alteromonadaceae TaxID=72275 RepID=UPI003D083D78